MLKFFTIGLICLIALALSACGGSTTDSIQVQDAWVRAAAMPEMDVNSNSSMPDSGHMGGGNERGLYAAAQFRRPGRPAGECHVRGG